MLMDRGSKNSTRVDIWRARHIDIQKGTLTHRHIVLTYKLRIDRQESRKKNNREKNNRGPTDIRRTDRMRYC